MPSGDRTGPMGQGPMTGRTFGYCMGYDTPGYAKVFGGGMGRGFRFGRGMRRGMGFGRGRNFGWHQTGLPQTFPWTYEISKEDEIKMLKEQAETLIRTQKDIEKRLSELEKNDK